MRGLSRPAPFLGLAAGRGGLGLAAVGQLDTFAAGEQPEQPGAGQRIAVSANGAEESRIGLAGASHYAGTSLAR